MKCARCGRETTEGISYRFYFGKRGQTDMPDRRTTRTHYKIVGSEDAFLCDQCVGQHIERRARLTAGGVFVVTMLLATLRVVLGGPAPQGSELETVVGFPTAFVAALVIYFGIRRWKRGRQREYMGDGLAIKLRKATLKQSGYDAFFTRQDHQRLS